MDITRIPISKLRKSEVSYLGEQVISIIEKHDPELLEIEPVFNFLKSKVPEIAKLKVSYGVDHLRLALIPHREKLVLCASSVKLRLKTLLKTTDAKDLVVIQTNVDSHLRYLSATKSGKELEKQIGGFLERVESDEELGAAIVEHGFMDDIDNLSMALKKVNSMTAARRELLSKRHKEPTQEIIDDVFKAVEFIFKELEVSPIRNPEVDYGPVINEVNVLMGMLSKSVRLRDAYNKRKAAQKKGETEGEMEDETNDSATEGDSTEVQVTVDDGDGFTEAMPTYLSSIKKLEMPTMEQSEQNVLSNEAATNEVLDESLETKKAAGTGFDDLTQQLSNGNKA